MVYYIFWWLNLTWSNTFFLKKKSSKCASPKMNNGLFFSWFDYSPPYENRSGYKDRVIPEKANQGKPTHRGWYQSSLMGKLREGL